MCSINLLGWTCKVFLITYTERVVRTQNIDFGVKRIMGKFPRSVWLQAVCAFWNNLLTQSWCWNLLPRHFLAVQHCVIKTFIERVFPSQNLIGWLLNSFKFANGYAIYRNYFFFGVQEVMRTRFKRKDQLIILRREEREWGFLFKITFLVRFLPGRELAILRQWFLTWWCQNELN